MNKSTVIMTGCDANFYQFMEESIDSWIALGLDLHADIGILDLGLTAEQLTKLRAIGCQIVKPTWTIEVPEELKLNHQVGLVARTALRDYFPGYRVYLWFDADAWAQTPEFFTSMVAGVQSKGAAVIYEDGAGVSRNFSYNKWWYGHMIASYGLIDGIKVAFPPAINIGIVALSDTAPHWDAWIRHYKVMIDKRNRTNLDQHAFVAALSLENLPAERLPARCNWITTLSHPFWDPREKYLCEPVSGGKPISVLHMAGPNKRRNYDLKTTDGERLVTPITRSAIEQLKCRQ